MSAPSVVGGSFFRALRLAVEFHQRGWSPVICNFGPQLDDPKVEQAQAGVRFIYFDHNPPTLDRRTACRIFEALGPAVIVFGEGPFKLMEEIYAGAKMVRR